MVKELTRILDGKKILILGFGMEGQSTYELLLKIPDIQSLTIADRDSKLPDRLNFKIRSDVKTVLGKSYISNLDTYDLIIKSPGIPKHLIDKEVAPHKITSQADLFLKLYSKNTIGITGTKGKSTTSSLIKHILSGYYDDVKLIGNIGVPPFEVISDIKEDTLIVFELSSHQLDDVKVSPHIAVFLNLFQEHLDHYGSYDKYQLAKFNIVKYQTNQNWLIFNNDDDILKDYFGYNNKVKNSLRFSLKKDVEYGAWLNDEGNIVYKDFADFGTYDFHDRNCLPGNHNLQNIMASLCVCKLLNVPDDSIINSIRNFKGLEHRLEYVGTFKGIKFFNDSIATIPEATIEAIKTLGNVDTLILGGKDRGIDYGKLTAFLSESNVKNLIFMGEAGLRMKFEMPKNTSVCQLHFAINHFDNIASIIRENTIKGSICLLSPAASSYDMFRNFEERGNAFKKIAENL